MPFGSPPPEAVLAARGSVLMHQKIRENRKSSKNPSSPVNIPVLTEANANHRMQASELQSTPLKTRGLSLRNSQDSFTSQPSSSIQRNTVVTDRNGVSTVSEINSEESTTEGSISIPFSPSTGMSNISVSSLPRSPLSDRKRGPATGKSELFSDSASDSGSGIPSSIGEDSDIANDASNADSNADSNAEEKENNKEVDETKDTTENIETIQVNILENIDVESETNIEDNLEEDSEELKNELESELDRILSDPKQEETPFLIPEPEGQPEKPASMKPSTAQTNTARVWNSFSRSVKTTLVLLITLALFLTVGFLVVTTVSDYIVSMYLVPKYAGTHDASPWLRTNHELKVTQK